MGLFGFRSDVIYELALGTFERLSIKRPTLSYRRRFLLNFVSNAISWLRGVVNLIVFAGVDKAVGRLIIRADIGAWCAVISVF